MFNAHLQLQKIVITHVTYCIICPKDKILFLFNVKFTCLLQKVGKAGLLGSKNKNKNAMTMFNIGSFQYLKCLNLVK